MTKTRVLLIALVAGLAWFYFPPLGTHVDLPDLESFLQPDVPHAKPVFISTADHVYYRVRLNRPVQPWFSWTYFQQLRMRGVQFDEITTSRFAPGFRREGWMIAVAREANLTPYTIEYWKSVDYKTSSFPVFMRWPWVYVRLGRSVLQHHNAVLIPESDTVDLTVAIPRHPGAVLRRVSVTGWLITLEFCAPATPEDILFFFGDLFGRDKLGNDVRSYVEKRDFVAEFAVPQALAVDLMHPEGFRVAVRNMLFSDDPLVIYPADLVERVSPDMSKQQPAGLGNLPKVSVYHITLRYGSEKDARQALARIAPAATSRGTAR